MTVHGPELSFQIGIAEYAGSAHWRPSIAPMARPACQKPDIISVQTTARCNMICGPWPAVPRNNSPMRRLLLSIHDVGPRFEAEVDLLLERVTRHVAPDRLAMLVVPDHWGEHPLTPGTPFANRLRAWSDAGISLFAHGWFHKDVTVHRGMVARFKGRHMTAGEGEFLGLDEGTALARMIAARDLIQTITGRSLSGFVAPAWLYGPGAMAALSRSGFALAEDHMKVWHPESGRVLARGPVITWASRSRARIVSSLFAARILPPMLRLAPVVRVAVHPGDVTISDLLVSIDDTLRRLCRTHVPASYDDLHPTETALAHPHLPAQF